MISSHVLVSIQPPSTSWPFIFVIQLFSTKIRKYWSEFPWCWIKKILVKNRKYWPKFGWSWINQILVKNQKHLPKFRWSWINEIQMYCINCIHGEPNLIWFTNQNLWTSNSMTCRNMWYVHYSLHKSSIDKISDDCFVLF